jgi:CRP/FNR family transcriptional regulator, cyclic AMP receptor protein
MDEIHSKGAIEFMLPDVQISAKSAARSGSFGKIRSSFPTFSQAGKKAARELEFDLDHFLLTGGDTTAMKFRKEQSLFAQGDSADSVYFVRSGTVKMVVVSNKGKEATIGLIGAGSFCGEGCLNEEPVRQVTATAMTAGTALRIPRKSFSRLLRESYEFSAVFTTFLIARSARAERDLIDQRFHSSEYRLASLLLGLAGGTDEPCGRRMLPRISQEALASMVGTTRSRISFFLNKFKKEGLIEYSGGIRIKRELENLVRR